MPSHRMQKKANDVAVSYSSAELVWGVQVSYGISVVFLSLP